jgi:hypothetical protein
MDLFNVRCCELDYHEPNDGKIPLPMKYYANDKKTVAFRTGKLATVDKK